MRDPTRETVAYSIAKAQHEALRVVAKQEQRSVSNLMREIIDVYLAMWWATTTHRVRNHIPKEAAAPD